MPHHCSLCGYETNRKANYIRHINRKISCSQMSGTIKEIVPENSNLQCSKCQKMFTRADNCKVHEKKCIGVVNPKQCKTCLKTFTSVSGRCKHNKYVKCEPPVSNDKVEEFAEIRNKMIDTMNLYLKIHNRDSSHTRNVNELVEKIKELNKKE